MKPFVKLAQPSLIELVLGIIFTVFVILIANTGTVLTSLIGSYDNQSAQSLLQQYGSSFSTSGNQEFLGRLTNVLIWGVVGAIFYILLWIAINSYIAVRNDVVIGTRFTRPAASGRNQYWVETTGRFLLRFGAVIILLFLVSWTVQVWLPTSVQLFHRWTAYHQVVPYIRSVLLGVVGWLLVLHLMVIALRLAFLRIRLFSNEEMRSSHHA